MQVAYIMKKAVFLRIVLTAAVLALLLSGCRFVRVEDPRMGYFLLQNFLDRRILRRQEFRPIPAL